MKNEIRYQQIAALLAKSLRRNPLPAGDEKRDVAETPCGEAMRDETSEATETIGGER